MKTTTVLHHHESMMGGSESDSRNSGIDLSNGRIDSPSTSSEPDPKRLFTIDEFIKAVDVKTYKDKLSLTFVTTATIALPFLYANAAWRFFNIEFRGNIRDIILYECTLHLQEVEAINNDLKVLIAEAVGITTTTVGVASLPLVIALVRQLGKYCYHYNKKQILINRLTELHIKDAKKIQSLHIPSKRLTQIKKFLKDDANSVVNKIEESSPTELSWEKWADELKAFRSELSKYWYLILLFAAPYGLAEMFWAAEDFNRDTGCHISTVLLDLEECDVPQQYGNIAMQVYPWRSISFSWLTFLVLMISLRSLSPSSARSWVEKTIHNRYEKLFLLRKEDEDKWAHHTLVWSYVSNIFLVPIIGVAVYRASGLANRYADLVGCESMFRVVTSVLLHKHNEECTKSDEAMVLGGYLGDVESKIFIAFHIMKLMTYILASVVFKVFSVKEKISLEWVKAKLKKFNDIDKQRFAAALVTCAIGGFPLFFLAKAFGEDTLEEGISRIFDFSSSVNTTSLDHNSTSTLPVLAREYCPYGNLPWNMTFPLNINDTHRLHDNIFQLQFVPGCPNNSIFQAYAYAVVDYTFDCNPFVIGKALGAFVIVFWLGSSIFPSSALVLSSTYLFSKWGLESCSNKDKQIENIDEEDKNKGGYKLMFDEEDEEKKEGCLSRVWCRLFKRASPVVSPISSPNDSDIELQYPAQKNRGYR